jgi:quercetin dioxygenase-like cupin family protein
VSVARAASGAALNLIYLSPGGGLGRHPAVARQLFVVVAGSGWVTGDDDDRIDIGAGRAALWEAGEEHESGTDVGMTVAVLEGPDLQVPD